MVATREGILCAFKLRQRMLKGSFAKDVWMCDLESLQKGRIGGMLQTEMVAGGQVKSSDFVTRIWSINLQQMVTEDSGIAKGFYESFD